MKYILLVFLFLSTGNVFAAHSNSKKEKNIKRHDSTLQERPFKILKRDPPPVTPVPLRSSTPFPPVTIPLGLSANSMMFPSSQLGNPRAYDCFSRNPSLNTLPLVSSTLQSLPVCAEVLVELSEHKKIPVEHLRDLSANKILSSHNDVKTIVAFDIDGVILKSTHELAYFAKSFLNQLDDLLLQNIEKVDRRDFKKYLRDNHLYRDLQDEEKPLKQAYSYVDEYVVELIDDLNNKGAVTMALTGQIDDNLNPKKYKEYLNQLKFSASKYDFDCDEFFIDGGIGYLKPKFAKEKVASKTIIINHIIDGFRKEGFMGEVRIVYIDDDYSELVFPKIGNWGVSKVSFEPFHLRQLINETEAYYKNKESRKKLATLIKSIYVKYKKLPKK